MDVLSGPFWGAFRCLCAELGVMEFPSTPWPGTSHRSPTLNHDKKNGPVQQKTKVPEAASKVLRLPADSRHVLGSRMQAYPEQQQEHRDQSARHPDEAPY